MCETHWPMLPDEMRRQLQAWFSIDRDGAGYRNVVQRAQAWVLKTFGSEDRERRDPGKWHRLVRWVRERDESRARRRAAPAPEPATPMPKQTVGGHLRLVRDDE